MSPTLSMGVSTVSSYKRFCKVWRAFLRRFTSMAKEIGEVTITSPAHFLLKFPAAPDNNCLSALNPYRSSRATTSLSPSDPLALLLLAFLEVVVCFLAFLSAFRCSAFCLCQQDCMFGFIAWYWLPPSQCQQAWGKF